MRGNATRGARSALAAISVACVATTAAAQDRTRDCAPQNTVAATARTVSDGRSFTLSDGRDVRLAAIEVPPAMAKAAASALAAHVAGRALRLNALAPASDRYGRLNMLAFNEPGAGPVSIDVAMVAQGLALASLHANGCFAALKAAERSARRARLGLWATDGSKADNPAAILAGQGGFAVVEGKVLSVRDSGGTIYLNFGRRWSEDFTVTILKRNERKFGAAGMVPRQLEGRTVRVRGFVEERGGPWIEAQAPEQIELADGN